MITVYTKNLCGYCHLAMNYLKENNFEFEEINIDYNPEAREFLKNAGHKTCPQIYYRNNLLVEGGCNGLLTLSKEKIDNRIQSFNLDNFDFDISHKL
tara:strand:+ start:7090 stop:7380 length:291 start_codon:yes stop_codon:yes gene_type:complete